MRLVRLLPVLLVLVALPAPAQQAEPPAEPAPAEPAPGEMAPGEMARGVVWRQPDDLGAALRDLQAMRGAGVTAVRTDEAVRSVLDPNGVLYYPWGTFDNAGVVAIRPHPLLPSAGGGGVGRGAGAGRKPSALAARPRRRPTGSART